MDNRTHRISRHLELYKYLQHTTAKSFFLVVLTLGISCSNINLKRKDSGQKTLKRNHVYFSTDGGEFILNNRKITSSPISQINDFLEKGFNAIILPGQYNNPIDIKASGSEDHPLLIKAYNSLAIIDGMKAPSKLYSYCIRIKESKWITIDGLTIKNCWGVGISIKNSSQLIIKNLKAAGSRYLILAEGDQTNHIKILNNYWNQDPSETLWKEIDWAEAHHGKYSYYNGSLFGADGISDVLIKGNTIKNAYNGIRMHGDLKNIKTKNANIEITGNLFENIRDNAIEPEISAYNWWIHHNKIHNGHAWISLTEVAGGYIYIFGNIGWNDTSYGKKNDHNYGTVLKFAKTGPFPNDPIYVFNNTWIAQGDYIRPRTATRNLVHFNNIIYLQKNKSSTFGKRNFHKSYKLAHDMTNAIGENIIPQWHYQKITDAPFKNLSQANFSLLPNSAAIDAGKVLVIDSNKVEYKGSAPDVGAYEGNEIIQGPVYFKR